MRAGLTGYCRRAAFGVAAGCAGCAIGTAVAATRLACPLGGDGGTVFVVECASAREPVLLDVDGPRIGALHRGVVPRRDMECQGDDEGGGSIAGRFVAAAGETRRRIVGRRERSGVTGINMSIRSSLEDVCAHVSEHDNDSRPGGTDHPCPPPLRP